MISQISFLMDLFGGLDNEMIRITVYTAFQKYIPTGGRMV
jgi:hypothetical protein